MACWTRLCVVAFSFSFLFFSLSGVRIVLADGEEISDAPVRHDAAAEKELELLRSKIAALELAIEERTHKHKSKDDKIIQLEKIIQEKSKNIASLQVAIDSLKKKRARDVEDRVGKAHAQASELENQVAILKSKIDLQNKQREAVELRAADAERKTKEVNAKMGSLEKISEEQKIKIAKLEKEFQSAEKKLLKAQLHAEAKTKELSEVQNIWLPHWLAVYYAEFQSFAAKKWNEYGEPTWSFASQKAVENIAKVQEWAKPHIEEINYTWIPLLKDKWVEVSTAVEPHVRTITTKSLEAYGELKAAVSPHLLKVKEMADPYLEDAKRISKPYIDQIATSTKPHVEKAAASLEPYTKQAIHVYQKSLKSVNTYHNQVQSSVRRKLKQHELTRPLDTKEIVWYLATVLLALPAIVVYKVYSFLFRRKVQNPVCGSQSNHTHRRLKRRHA